MTDDAPTQRIIYLRAVVDPAALLHSRTSPADALAPTDVDAASGQLIVTSPVQTSARAAGPVAFAADIGDTVRIYAITGSNNFEEAVLIKDIRRTGTDEPIEGFAPVELQRSAIVPGADAEMPSIDTADQSFWFWQGTVAGHGIQDCSLVLALYARDETGQPRFAGLYRWDLQLTVSDETANPEEPEERTS